MSHENPTTAVMGIDPGKHGGISIIDQSHRLIVHKMPETEEAFVELFRRYAPSIHHLLVEHVTGFIGGKWQPGSRMFNFGWWAAAPVFTALAMVVPCTKVMAQVWQREIGLPTKKELGEDVDWKGHLALVARGFFPDVKITKQVADSVLLAELAYRRYILNG